MFRKITIIGIGLIGSSLARRIKRDQIAETLIAADVNPEVCDVVREIGFADEVIADIGKSVMGSDLVILAVPLGAYEDVAKKIGPALKPGCIVSDVGSVKQSAINAIKPYLPDSVHLVPVHPIAGTEHSGPRAGFPELFDNRWSIITPEDETDIEAVSMTSQFWEACGARIEIMAPKRHDLVLAITSHLPHLIAYTIVDTADQLEDDLKADVIKYSASGFYGFTRIAASDPIMWRDVFLHNKDAVLEILQRFTEDLTALQKSIRRGDGTYLHDTFARTRAIRRSVIELGEMGRPAPLEKLTGESNSES